jgi:hypothetical protein
LYDLYDLYQDFSTNIEQIIEYIHGHEYDDMHDDIEKEAEYIQQKLESYQVGNLKDALHHPQIEIMLDCDKYLAINLDHFDTVKE